MTCPPPAAPASPTSPSVDEMMDAGAHRLALLFMREIEAAEAWDAETEDGVRTDKRAKALISMAKAGQAIRQLARPEPDAAAAPPRRAPPGRGAGQPSCADQDDPAQPEETDMDDDFSNDPAGLEALRDTLERRLERIARDLEAKGRAGADDAAGPGGAEPKLAAKRPRRAAAAPRK